MVCIQSRWLYPLANISGPPIAVAWRLFRDRSALDIHVLYWHMVSGKLYDYRSESEALRSPSSWVKNALAQAFLGAGEQYFLRITSNVPVEALQQEAGFRIVVEAMGKLGS